jgi:hypothetical protein
LRFWLCSSCELARELDWHANQVDDTLAALVRSGLAHLHGDFAFASRAAVRAAQLV